ncbi:hypothetical protein [Streptomyces sp. NPDC048111]|uniref:hypothetical protein n=1 Tax=Streptomyces sp. NPDC048111 TaxID=3365500 RepID=UPI0037106E17
MYTATAGGPSATGALTAAGDGVAARQSVRAAVHDLVPFTTDDPRGAGMTAALLPMIFGGIFPDGSHARPGRISGRTSRLPDL